MYPLSEEYRSLDASDKSMEKENRPLVSLIIPAYNEAAILKDNLTILCRYMGSLETAYQWELLVINDGSTDGTGELAEEFASAQANIRVFHHTKNFGLGQAIIFAFHHCRGDYVITFDIDLSYSPDHIDKMLTKITKTNARVVLASPYMDGGRISNIPWFRRTLSIWANRFLSLVAQGKLSTLTSMVRTYDGRFLRSLNLRATSMSVMPELIYKAIILSARIEQVPAHLDWGVQNAAKGQRRSSMKILRHTVSTLFSGFLFRPFIFFIIPGFLLFLFSIYVNSWMVIHFLEQYQEITQYTSFFNHATEAVAAAYKDVPHTFVIGLLSLMLSIQLIGLGILSLQSKRYFEELFHLGSTIYRHIQTREKING